MILLKAIQGGSCMNRILKRITTLAVSVCLCLISTVSCGEKEAVIKPEKEKLKPRPKLVEYAPTDEIKNASLSSGLIQIGNDVFRNGGYYTVGQLMEELEGKYELQGGIDIDGVLVGDEEKVGIYLPVDVQISDEGIPAYDIALYYSNMKAEDGEKTPVKDAIVYKISYDVFDYNVFDEIWHPGAIKAFPAEIEFSEIADVYEKNGLKKVDSESLFIDCSESHEYNVYTENNNYAGQNKSAASAMICGSEKNLYGVYPIFYYEFAYEEDSKKVLSFQWDDVFSTFYDYDEKVGTAS